MQIRVRLFAGQRDIVGRSSMTLDAELYASVGELWAQLVAQYPQLASYTEHMLYAVNQEFSSPEARLRPGDEVAFIPPVSGGVERAAPDTPAAQQPAASIELFRITPAPLDPAPLVRLVQSPAAGAVVTFAGVVRNHFEGRATAFLTYEAYTDMAVSVMEQIADEARARWPDVRAAIHHRVGRLEIGETAVLVVVAAPHRQEAFAAAQYIMDRLKEIAPIWKKEHWAEGQPEWHDR
jgi:molybdopterin synthase catalytic subunit